MKIKTQLRSNANTSRKIYSKKRRNESKSVPSVVNSFQSPFLLGLCEVPNMSRSKSPAQRNATSKVVLQNYLVGSHQSPNRERATSEHKACCMSTGEKIASSQNREVTTTGVDLYGATGCVAGSTTT